VHCDLGGILAALPRHRAYPRPLRQINGRMKPNHPPKKNEIFFSFPP
jgi:hypothetical protein